MSCTKHTGTTLHDLTDDLIWRVLQLVEPRPGLRISPKALDLVNRRRWERNTVGRYWRKPVDFYKEDRAWGECLDSVDVPPALKEHPPWQQSSKTLEVYNEATVCMPAAERVCRRWRALLQDRGPVKVSVCGLNERPPSSTKVLVVASPELWQLQHGDAPHFVSHLPDRGASLHGIVFWSAAPPNCGEISSPNTQPRFIGLPAVLEGQCRDIKHLIYVSDHKAPQHIPEPFASGAVDSLASLPSLQCLTLPRTLKCPHLSGELLRKLLSNLPQLASLSGNDVCVHSPYYPRLRALRSLHSSCAAASGVAALSELSPLQSLCLEECRDAPELDGLASLSQLKHLELQELTLVDGVHKLSLLTSLTSLKVRSGSCPPEDPHDDQMADILAAFAEPPQLTLLSITSSEDLARFAKLTSLVELDVKCGFYFDEDDSHEWTFFTTQNGGALSALTRLTALDLYGFGLDGAACAAVGQLTTLERLHVNAPVGVDTPEALRSLSALRSLYLDFQWDEREPRTLLDALQLSTSCLSLMALSLHFPTRNTTYHGVPFGAPLEASELALLTDLSELEEIELGGLAVTDTALSQLRKMPQLSILRLVDVDNVTAAGLRHLSNCQLLRFVSVTGYEAGVADGVAGLQAQGVEVRLIGGPRQY